VLVVEEALALCDPGITWPGERVRLSELIGEPVDLLEWGRIQSHVQWGEIGSTLGTWVATNPALGPATKMNFELVASLDRTALHQAIERRERICEALKLERGTILCFPTTPTRAPLKGSLGLDRTKETYYGRVLGLTCIAGLVRLPQLSVPVAGLPVGLSLVGGPGQEHTLLAYAADAYRQEIPR
jgi:amidase